MKMFVLAVGSFLGITPASRHPRGDYFGRQFKKVRSYLGRVNRQLASGSLFLTLLVLVGCSFKPTASNDKSQTQVTQDGHIITNPMDDSDGDKVLDGEEVKRGTDPLVADLPLIRASFFQNYKIAFEHGYSDEQGSAYGNEVYESHIRAGNPGFKYRVGDLMLKSIAHKNAARVGRFESHSWAPIQRHNLTWVKYPDLDPIDFHQTSMQLNRFFKGNYELSDFKMVFDSSITLQEGGPYKEIKNVKVAFRYYDYEKQSYELVHTALLERVFQAGVQETFQVEIEALPRKVMEDNFAMKGELLISEIVDFDIPDLNTTYQVLMASVKAKCIPLHVTTPLQTSVYWVGLPGGGASFQQILSRVFDDQFTVEDNNLKKVQQFETNLPSYSHLAEVKGKDKLGKWFVFTDRLTRHYLQHRYTTADIVSINYVTGAELGSQIEDKVYSHFLEAKSGDEFTVHKLGNLTSNSELNIQLKPYRRWGDGLRKFSEEHHTNGPGCRNNCMTQDTHCYWDVNHFTELDEFFDFNQDLSGELSRVAITIGTQEYPLKTLLDEGKALITWYEDSLHLQVLKPAELAEIQGSDVQPVGLKLTTLRGDDFNGIKLVRMTGRQHYYCPMHTSNFAHQAGIPLSVESLEFAQWQQSVHWDKVTRGERKYFKQPFSLEVISSISKFHN